MQDSRLPQLLIFKRFICRPFKVPRYTHKTTHAPSLQIPAKFVLLLELSRPGEHFNDSSHANVYPSNHYFYTSIDVKEFQPFEAQIYYLLALLKDAYTLVTHSQFAPALLFSSCQLEEEL